METQAEKIKTKEKREEALARMKLMKLNKGVIKRFREKGKITVAFETAIDNKAYDASTRDLMLDFEKTHKAFVYLIIRADTDDGLTDSLFFVSDNSEEWENDCKDLASRKPYVYVVNHDEPALSRFDSISYKMNLFRIPYRI